MKFWKSAQYLFIQIGFCLTLFTFAHNVLDFGITSELETILRGSSGLPPKFWILLLTNFVLGLLFPPLLMMISLFAILKSKGMVTNFRSFFKKNAEPLLIESTRVVGSSLLWSLFLILPGIFRFFQLSLTPFIVVLSKDYDAGNVDALKLASKIFLKKSFKFFSTQIFFFLIFPVLFAVFFDSYKVPWETPLESFLVSYAESIVLLLGTFSIYLLLHKEFSEVNL